MEVEEDIHPAFFNQATDLPLSGDDLVPVRLCGPVSIVVLGQCILAAVTRHEVTD